MARILVVEDNLANMELMVYLLHASGHVTVAVGDGEHALRVADEARPDLIICDIQLPKLDGYGVVRSLKAKPEFALIPIVAVTALAMVGDRDRILSAGFDGYLAKPLEPETFVQQIESFLGSARSERRPGHVSEEVHRPIRYAATLAKILVLDNVPANLELAVDILCPFGYEVITSSTALDALAMAIELHPDLILSDVCMPRGNGFEFLQTVKAHPDLARIPFVFITSSMLRDIDRQRGLALGADRYLIRPIDPHELLAEIKALLSREDLRG